MEREVVKAVDLAADAIVKDGGSSSQWWWHVLYLLEALEGRANLTCYLNCLETLQVEIAGRLENGWWGSSL